MPNKSPNRLRTAAHALLFTATWAAVAILGCDSPGGAVVVDDDGGSDATPCASGKTSCAGSCVTLATDKDNCGACGSQCASPLVCTHGACATGCGSGTTLCGGSCADLTSDPDHCGACGTKCATGDACMGGKCKLA